MNRKAKPKVAGDKRKDPQDSEALLRLVADSVPVLIAYYDAADFKCRFANRRYAEYFGLTAQDILGMTLQAVVGPQRWQAIEAHVKRAMSGMAVNYMHEVALPDGGVCVIDVNLIPHLSPRGAKRGMFVQINDISELWRAGQAMRESEIRQRKFALATGDGLVFHHEGQVTDANEAALKLTGYALEEVLGRTITDFLTEPYREIGLQAATSGSEEAYEASVLHKDGTEIPVELRPRTMPMDGESYRLVVIRDLRSQRQAQERIEYLALHDPLTQLPNRIYLREHLLKLLALTQRQNAAVALLSVDLDNFKGINERYGHEIADELLHALAARLQAVVRQSDFVARLGGDEFLVALSDVGGKAEVAQVAESVLQSIRAPIEVGGQELTIYPSIGISRYPDDGQTSDELIRHADQAVSLVKRGGGNAFGFYQAGASANKS